MPMEGITFGRCQISAYISMLEAAEVLTVFLESVVLALFLVTPDVYLIPSTPLSLSLPHCYPFLPSTHPRPSFHFSSTPPIAPFFKDSTSLPPFPPSPPTNPSGTPTPFHPLLTPCRSPPFPHPLFPSLSLQRPGSGQYWENLHESN